ncbi:MAG: response regulator [archaeon]
MVSKYVIVAEDTPNDLELNLAFIKRFIEDNNLDVEIHQVYDGRPLVDKVKAAEVAYDIIFTDNRMLELYGSEAIKQIRALGFKMPICMVSGDDYSVERAVLDSGANDFIHKPVSYGAFEAVLKKYLL